MRENIPTFLIDMLNKQYGENLTKTILEGYSKIRKTTLRVNTLKVTSSYIKEILKKENIEYEKPLFYENAFILTNSDEKTIKELDIYEKGEIYLQSLSSMLPPIILSPKEKNDILDMCAAPGGKTTELAVLSENKANITACEMNSIRFKRLKYNIEKQGATSVYTMQKDARFIEDFFSFDSILLDAPCSGSGTLNENNEKQNKYFTMELINKSISSQLALLRKASKILKKGGEMVYSTCSILACENEDVINKILKETNLEIVPISFKEMESLPLLPTKIDGTICVAPNELYEGFFVAKLKKEYCI